MRSFIFFILFAVFANSWSAQSDNVELSLEIPVCKMPKAKPLPEKYYRFSEQWKEFLWVRKVKSNDSSANGSGYERIDGSQLFNWHNFGKLDINGDGTCDWFLVSLAPYSSGAGGGILNTLYVGTPTGWLRIGAQIPNNDPDVLGAGNSSKEQENFSFSSEALISIWDKKGNVPYLIGSFDKSQDSGRLDQDGYHIYIWDSVKNKLKELDKWQPQSAAAQVYAFFKKNGAVDTSTTGIDRRVNFDPKIEKDELEKGCSNESLLHRSSGFFKVCQTQRRVEDKLY